jgi:hypothetical protein
MGGVDMYYSLFTGKPANQGQGKFPPSLYREGRDLLDDFPKESAVRLLQRWQTDYIVVDEAAFDQTAPGWRARLAAQPLIDEVYHQGGYRVFRLKR